MLKRAVLHQNWGFNIVLESWCGKSALMLAKMLFPHQKSGSIFLVFSCDQAALRTHLSVRPSVHLSVCLSVTPFSLCSSHHIIMKFSGVITIDKSDVHARDQGQRLKVKVTNFKVTWDRKLPILTRIERFRTVTPV